MPGIAPGHLETSGARWPRKIGTNWFMPALVNSKLGESGNKLEEGTIVCPFDLKKSKNDCRISVLVICYFIRLAAPSRMSIFARDSAEKLNRGCDLSARLRFFVRRFPFERLLPP